MALLLIADNKMYRFEEGKTSEIKSGILEKYREKLYDNAKRKEWKTSGSGARFLDQLETEDAEDKLRNLSVKTDSLSVSDSTLFFSQTIDGASGIYSKIGENEEGIVIADSSVRYGEFDEKDKRLAVTASFAGECHIGLVTPGVPECTMLTEGETVDRQPAWSCFEENVLYYSSAGLAITGEEEPKGQASPFSRPQMTFRALGPASLCRLDLSSYEIDELFADPRQDFIKPSTDRAGNLYFIRKPYRAAESKNISVGGCLLDILLFPLRLVQALLGFLNFFSMAFSGKSIRKSGSSATKTKSEADIYIDGNLIRADKEQKNNRKKGDKNPGIIPRSFELCRRAPDGTVSVLKKGVIAYRVSDEGIYLSNGSEILLLTEKGEEKICSLAHVTYINEEKSV